MIELKIIVTAIVYLAMLGFCGGELDMFDGAPRWLQGLVGWTALGAAAAIPIAALVWVWRL